MWPPLSFQVVNDCSLKRTLRNILIAAAICIVPVQARASGLWHWFSEIFDLGSEIKDFGDQIAEGIDLTNRADLSNENLEAAAHRAEKFHAPNGQTNQIPQFGPEDLFSPDPARRQEIEDQWDAYVAAQNKSASFLHNSRDRQATNLEHYRAALKISDIMKDFYWKVGKTPGTFVQYEYAKKAAELEGVSQNLGSVISEYERIVKEYDQNIGKFNEQLPKIIFTTFLGLCQALALLGREKSRRRRRLSLRLPMPLR